MPQGNTATAGVTPGNESSVAATGVPNAVTGDQPPANAGLTLEAIERLLDTKIAPVIQKQREIDNDRAARARISRRDGTQTATSADAATSASQIISAIPEGPAREWAQRAQETLDAIARGQAEAAAEAERSKASNALESLITEHKPARVDRLRREMLPYLKVGTDGKVYHDYGGVMRPVADVFRENLADDVYRPASGSNGTGTVAGSPPTIGTQNAWAGTDKVLDPVEALAAGYSREAALRK